MKSNSPDPELRVIDLSQLESLSNGCSVSLLQELKEVESDLTEHIST